MSNYTKHCRKHCYPRTEQAVVDALTHPAVACVNLVWGVLHVNRQSLAGVASAVGSGAVVARHAPNQFTSGPGGAWSSRWDELTFSDEEPDGSLVVHEATHMLQDACRFPKDVVTSEAIANLAEAIYRLARSRMESSNYGLVVQRFMHMEGIDGAATRVAMSYNMVTPAMKYLRQEHLTPIEAEVAKHPHYQRAIANGGYIRNGIKYGRN